MIAPIRGKKILLGVTGSIAAYKGADLASKLTQAGALVDVILTESAEKFVAPLTFQSLTGRPVFTDADLWSGQGHVTHVALGRQADLLVVAPASANTLAKLARGIADNLLCIAALAARCPLILAPAMDAGMFEHPATQANLEILRERGARFLGPVEGRMASGLMGLGRFMEPPEIMANIRYILSRAGPLKDKKVLVTAGGTQEPIDPVRVIANRSSGKQGYALAQAALDAGADVVLVSAPASLPLPTGAQQIAVETAAQMEEAVLSASSSVDALVMAAAVADFRPFNPAGEKISKSSGLRSIPLEQTTDILAAVAQRKSKTGFPRFTVGFAAESQSLVHNAQEKLAAKRLDMIAANDITAKDAGFGVDTNRVTLIHKDGTVEELPLMSKDAVAEKIIEQITKALKETKDEQDDV